MDGALAAKGNFVSYLSSDDCWHPRFLEETLRYADAAHGAYSDFYVCDSKLKPTRVYESPDGLLSDIIAYALLKNMYINFSCSIFPRRVFDGCKFEKMRYGEDLIFLLDTVIASYKWNHIPKPLAYYRQHKNSGTAKYRYDVSKWFLVWKHLKNRLLKLGVNEKRIEEAMLENYRVLYPRSLKAKGKDVARTFLNTIWPLLKIRPLLKNLLEKDAKRKNQLRPMLKFAAQHFNCKNLVGAEVGVYKGENAVSMLKNLPLKNLYLIDPYKPYSQDGILINPQHTKKTALKNLVPYKTCTWVSASNLPSNLDFVYIDGNHDYEYVKKDLQFYYGKVRDSGLLGGHDFSNEWAGVTKAVTEFAVNTGRRLFVEQSDWWFIKEAEGSPYPYNQFGSNKLQAQKIFPLEIPVLML